MGRQENNYGGCFKLDKRGGSLIGNEGIFAKKTQTPNLLRPQRIVYNEQQKMNEFTIPKRELKLDLNKEIESMKRSKETMTANNDYLDMRTQK